VAQSQSIGLSGIDWDKIPAQDQDLIRNGSTAVGAASGIVRSTLRARWSVEELGKLGAGTKLMASEAILRARRLVAALGGNIRIGALPSPELLAEWAFVAELDGNVQSLLTALDMNRSVRLDVRHRIQPDPEGRRTPVRTEAERPLVPLELRPILDGLKSHLTGAAADWRRSLGREPDTPMAMDVSSEDGSMCPGGCGRTTQTCECPARVTSQETG
jgi:hypothetical protein